MLIVFSVLFVSAIPNSMMTVQCGTDGSEISSRFRVWVLSLWSICTSFCWSLLVDAEKVNVTSLWMSFGKLSKVPNIMGFLGSFYFSCSFKVF